MKRHHGTGRNVRDVDISDSTPITTVRVTLRLRHLHGVVLSEVR